MDMRSALLRAAIAALSFGIVAGPFAAVGHSAAPICAGVEQLEQWTRIQGPAFREGPAGMTDYAIDPVNPSALNATNGQILMGSTDGGCDWKELFALELLPDLDRKLSAVNSTIVQIVVPEAPEPSGETTIYLVLEEKVGSAVRPHILRSRDAGSTWTIVDEGLPLVSGGVFKLAVAPGNRDIAYLLLRDDPVNLADTTYASHNGGATWEQRSTAASEGVATQVVVDPVDPATLWYWGAGGLYRSSDGGVSRSAIKVVDPSVAMVDVQHFPGAPAQILAYEAETQTFNRSTDGGATWARFMGPRIFSHSLAHGSTGDVVVSGHDGVYRLAGQEFWLPIHREEQPDLYDLQATRVGPPLLFGLSTENTIERYDALGHAVHVDPFERVGDLLSNGVGNTTALQPRDRVLKLDPGGSKRVDYHLGLPPHPRPLDVFFLVDTSMSMEPSINGLRAGMQDIIRDLEAARIDVQFGVGEYKDYPIPGYGDPDMGDFPYRLDRKIGPADADLADALEKLQASGGGRADLPESQLTGLFQAATGEGQPGFVTEGQDAGFRAGALKVIVHVTDAAFHTDAAHPSPPWEQVTAALRERDILQIGLAVYGPSGPDGLPHLTDMALDTDTRAPSPVDCDGDGTDDVAAGQPLACVVSTEQSEGVLELAPAIIATLRAVTQEVEVRLTGDDPQLIRGIAPTAYPAYNVLDAGRLDFEVTYSCPRELAGEKRTLRVAALVAGRPVAHAQVRLICRALPKEPKADDLPPVAVAALVIPRFLVPAPPPPPPPITESAPGTQQMFQAQPAAAAQEQEELQTAVAWQESLKKELAEEYSFTSLRREDPAPWLLYATGLLMSVSYGMATVVRRRLSLQPAKRRR